MFNSPLRYPGGKDRLARFIALISEKNGVGGHYVEPYAGGGAVALYLLFNGYVREVTINDLDRSVYAFWHSILYHTRRFCNRIADVDVNMDNWNRFRAIQNEKAESPLFELGFSTFFLNRTNMSGIIRGGVIGGKNQNGAYKMDCRFGRGGLIDRITRISKYKDKIRPSCLDAMDLVKKIQAGQNSADTVFYFDPPYYIKGPLLYMDHYAQKDHVRVAKQIQSIKHAKWMVSYDDMPEIGKIYADCPKKRYPIFHTAHGRHRSTEVMFFSSNLRGTGVPLSKIRGR